MFKSSIVGPVVEFFEHTLGIESDISIFIIVLLSGFVVLMVFLLIHWVHVKLRG